MSAQFVTTGENTPHEICMKELVFRNAKMNIYAILISQAPRSDKILVLEDTSK